MVALRHIELNSPVSVAIATDPKRVCLEGEKFLFERRWDYLAVSVNIPIVFDRDLLEGDGTL